LYAIGSSIILFINQSRWHQEQAKYCKPYLTKNKVNIVYNSRLTDKVWGWTTQIQILIDQFFNFVYHSFTIFDMMFKGFKQN